MAKRRISAKQRRIYRRRRIVAAVLAVVAVVLCWGIVWLLVKGVGAVNYAINKDDINAISRQAAPSPKEVSGVKNCTANDLDLDLSASSAYVVARWFGQVHGDHQAPRFGELPDRRFGRFSCADHHIRQRNNLALGFLPGEQPHAADDRQRQGHPDVDLECQLDR
ncbi:MAG: hypothetical protein LKI23_06180 [Bifidobacterium crudilactis]|nr:hypothetical protein [Bifidobacterium crudilactis]